MKVPALYHWSPKERREQILNEGLRLYSPPVTHSGEESYPYICFSTTPSQAWGMSGDIEWVSEYETWDLWQVYLDEHDEVHVRPFFGLYIEEIKVRNAIPADRVWWVAERSGLTARIEGDK